MPGVPSTASATFIPALVLCRKVWHKTITYINAPAVGVRRELSQMDIKVKIRDKDRNIGAMAKALAFEVDGPKSVVGSSKEFLAQNGYFVFHFSSENKANVFVESLGRYLPGFLVEVVNE